MKGIIDIDNHSTITRYPKEMPIVNFMGHRYKEEYIRSKSTNKTTINDVVKPYDAQLVSRYILESEVLFM